MNSVSELTRRERQVVHALLEGKTNRQIADELVIEVPTVQTHLSRIYCKLGVSTRLEAAVTVLRSGACRARPMDQDLRAEWVADIQRTLDTL